MQDHINKRIPALLTIMLTEAQNSNERDLSRKETDRVKKDERYKNTLQRFIGACAFACVCMHCMFTHRAPVASCLA